MARDRLAAMRAQQQGDSYGNNYNPTARQTRQQNPYDQRAVDDRSNNYELAQVGNQQPRYDAPQDDMAAFYDEIGGIQDEIRNFQLNIDQISKLHTQLLSNVEPSNSRSNRELDNLVEETRGLSDILKKRIQALQRQPGDPKTANTRKSQIELVRTKFLDAIKKYQAEEQLYRNKYKDRMIRQFKIVNPQATPEEIDQVVNNDQNAPIFAQAVMGNRYAESQGAYREVQQRHEEVQRIERTLVELAQLFNDMSLLVEQQNDAINNIETTAQAVEKDTEAGLGYTDKAVVSARAARKKRWICFFITLIILIIVGVAVGVEVSKNVSHNNDNSNHNSGS